MDTQSSIVLDQHLKNLQLLRRQLGLKQLPLLHIVPITYVPVVLMGTESMLYG